MPCPDSDQLEHMHTARNHAKTGLEFKTKTANDSAADIMRPAARSMTATTSQGIHLKEHVSTSDTNTEALCFIAHKDELQLGAPDKCSQYDRPYSTSHLFTSVGTPCHVLTQISSSMCTLLGTMQRQVLSSKPR